MASERKKIMDRIWDVPGVKEYLLYHAKKESAPREACPKCQFEVEQGTLEDHVCRLTTSSS